MRTKPELFKLMARSTSEAERQAFRNRIIEENLKLAYWFARRQCAGVPTDKHPDIVQECLMGLIQAAERFDPERETKFSSYATWWMRHNLQFTKGPDAFGDVTVPRYIREIVFKAAKEESYLEHAKCQKNAEIGNGIDFAVQIHKTRKASLDERVNEGAALHEMISSHSMDPETLTLASEALSEVEERIAEIESGLQTMTEKRREILARRYGFLGHLPKDQSEVSRQLDCTRQNVQQLEKKALAELMERSGFSEREITQAYDERQRLTELIN